MLRRICSCDGWRSSTFWIRRASRSLRSSLRIGLRAGENGALTIRLGAARTLPSSIQHPDRNGRCGERNITLGLSTPASQKRRAVRVRPHQTIRFGNGIARA